MKICWLFLLLRLNKCCGYGINYHMVRLMYVYGRIQGTEGCREGTPIGLKPCFLFIKPCFLFIFFKTILGFYVYMVAVHPLFETVHLLLNIILVSYLLCDDYGLFIKVFLVNYGCNSLFGLLIITRLIDELGGLLVNGCMIIG